jgi:hypothetical protein
MPRRKSLRSQLYRGARDLGNLEAAEKGPHVPRQAGGAPEGLPVHPIPGLGASRPSPREPDTWLCSLKLETGEA